MPKCEPFFYSGQPKFKIKSAYTVLYGYMHVSPSTNHYLALGSNEEVVFFMIYISVTKEHLVSFVYSTIGQSL